MRALNRHVERVFNPERKDHHWGKRKLKREQWPSLSTSAPASRLATPRTSRSSPPTDAAETWFDENDPEGVAFEYEVLE